MIILTCRCAKKWKRATLRRVYGRVALACFGSDPVWVTVVNTMLEMALARARTGVKYPDTFAF